MFWRNSHIRPYDPKDFPNYSPYPETNFNRLLKQWPAIPRFFVYTFGLMVSILTIFSEYFRMLYRDPLNYSKANEWIMDEYQSTPSGERMLYGWFLSFWFCQISLNLIYSACDILVEAYEDPVHACQQMFAFGLYLEHLLLHAVVFTLRTICSIGVRVVLPTSMLIWNLAMFICDTWVLPFILLFFLAMTFSIYQAAFSSTPEDATEQALIDTPKHPGQIFRVPAPSPSSSTVPCRPPGQLFLSGYTSHKPAYASYVQASTPKPSPPRYTSKKPAYASYVQTSSTSCARPPTQRYPFQRKSNKPTYASYVQVSPKALQKLHSEDISVPEHTRTRTYSEWKIADHKRLVSYCPVDIRVRTYLPKAGEKSSALASQLQEPNTNPFDREVTTVPTKNQCQNFMIAYIERSLIQILKDVQSLEIQLRVFGKESNPRPLPPADFSSPASPRSQQRTATLNDKARIGAAKAKYFPRLENAATDILSQRPQLEDCMSRLDRMLVNEEDAATRTIRRQLEHCRVRLELMFKVVKRGQVSARSIEEKCEDRMLQLDAEAAKLHRLDRTNVKGKRVTFSLRDE
ncbi:hypothetical protein F66182_2114 [Fusarium sp. NRRL 66182]|nr:hypothetical protein F66182_2114 [Fusarium sp. NRRL 66182]